MSESDTPGRRRRWWIAPGILLLLVAGAGWVVFSFARLNHDEFFVSDAALVIASHGLDLCRTDTHPTRADFEELGKRLHHASVIHLWYSDDGRVVDAWGTQFTFEVGRTEHGPTLTVVSAGPDRRFGTDDDISHHAPTAPSSQ